MNEGVPVRILRPRIESYLDRYGMNIEEFSMSMGYHRDSVRSRMYHGSTFTFDMADKIICKIGSGLYLWMCEPTLWRIYQSAKLSTDGTCAHCGEEFTGSLKAGRKKYCSERCRQKAYNKRRVEEKRRCLPQAA